MPNIDIFNEVFTFSNNVSLTLASAPGAVIQIPTQTMPSICEVTGLGAKVEQAEFYGAGAEPLDIGQGKISYGTITYKWYTTTWEWIVSQLPNGIVDLLGHNLITTGLVLSRPGSSDWFAWYVSGYVEEDNVENLKPGPDAILTPVKIRVLRQRRVNSINPNASSQGSLNTTFGGGAGGNALNFGQSVVVSPGGLSKNGSFGQGNISF